MTEPDTHPLGARFRGYLPVVVDVETGGFNCRTDALLEIAAVIIGQDAGGQLVPQQTVWHHVQPFSGAVIEEAALKVNGIDPFHPLRPAIPEREAMSNIFKQVREAMSRNDCTRAILVGHNAHFDLGFVNAAAERAGIKRNPFHPFSVFDTVTLAGIALGQTVLARSLDAAGLAYDGDAAHSARYDTERTAELFCLLANRMQGLFQSAVVLQSAEVTPP